ncbi:hypothetical protein X798_04924 [Onchocerca flexuosa]|uniref:Uncharacterized protein n=1 Tax=Onchocerca flexuosa TaxID=387005 RepID=A0A238BRZ7_9BILA|nr:hypothetical protein X798_04924 [Onchocerca flexuosa]
MSAVSLTGTGKYGSMEFRFTAITGRQLVNFASSALSIKAASQHSFIHYTTSERKMARMGTARGTRPAAAAAISIHNSTFESIRYPPHISQLTSQQRLERSERNETHRFSLSLLSSSSLLHPLMARLRRRQGSSGMTIEGAATATAVCVSRCYCGCCCCCCLFRHQIPYKHCSFPSLSPGIIFWLGLFQKFERVKTCISPLVCYVIWP